MTRQTLMAIAAGLLLWSAAGTRADAPADPLSSLPQGTDYDLVVRTCSSCHALDILATKAPEQKWSQVVTEMGARGAAATADELERIAVFLTRYMPVTTP
jgi:hypothetical protein